MSEQTSGTGGEALGAEPSATDEPTVEGAPIEEPVAPEPAPVAATAAAPAPAPYAGGAAPPGYVPPGYVPPAGASTPPPVGRPGFFVPRWLAIVVAAVVAALLFGGIGFAIGDSGGGNDGRREVSLPRGRTVVPPGMNFGPGAAGRGQTNPNGNGNGQVPAPATGSGFLGVSVDSPSSGSGAQVTGVASTGPAASAGLKTGDVITKVDDTTISAPVDLVRVIRSHNSGDSVTITYTRAGTSSTVTVTLGDRSQASSVPS